MDEDLTLIEPAALVEAAAGDGTVLIHLIRPCVGKGRGRRLYEADMLRENANKFVGWKMYVDHESPAARKAAGGLPRSIRDLGGRITEAWWDPDVPAEGRFGQGAVVGRALPTKLVRDLIADDPGLVETSINSMATGVKPVMRDGQRVMLVEGIASSGSVDWVTEAGAGGKVVSLIEAAIEESDEPVIAALDDEEFAEYLAETRPELLARLAEGKAPPFTKKKKADDEESDGDEDGKDDDGDGDGKHAALVAKLMKKGLPRKLAEKAAKRQLSEGLTDEDETTEVEEMPDITPQAVIEALSSEEGSAFLDEIVEARVAEKVEEERDLIRAEARAESERQRELHEMRDTARERITEAKLPAAMTADLTGQFALVEGMPSPLLNVFAEYDENGAKVKTAKQVLVEAVDERIASGRALLAELNPTRVKGVSGTTPDPAEGTEVEESSEQPERGSLVENALSSFTPEQRAEMWA